VSVEGPFFSAAFPPFNNASPALFHYVAGALLREPSHLLLLGGVRDGILFSQHFSTLSLLLFTPLSLQSLLPAGRIAGEILLAVCMRGPWRC
jgi:hypothetical protein